MQAPTTSCSQSIGTTTRLSIGILLKLGDGVGVADELQHVPEDKGAAKADHPVLAVVLQGQLDQLTFPLGEELGLSVITKKRKRAPCENDK